MGLVKLLQFLDRALSLRFTIQLLWMPTNEKWLATRFEPR